MLTRVIGIDPGPTPGMVMLSIGDFGPAHVDVLQCSHRLAPAHLSALLRAGIGPVIVQIEQFVVGRRAGRSSSSGAGAVTRDLIGRLQQECDSSTIATAVHLRAAGHVKPWASDVRLRAADLIVPTKGMTHARDACRHALYAAVHDAGLPDPLSKEWRS